MANRLKYGVALRVFAEAWKVSARTVGGLSKEDAPLQDVEALRTWWIAERKKELPEWLVTARDVAGACGVDGVPGPGGAIAVEGGSESGASPGSELRGMRDAGDEERGPEAQLRRLQELEVNLSERAKLGDVAAINQVKGISAELSKLERVVFDLRVKRGYYVDRERAEAAFGALLQDLRMCVRSAGESFAKALGVPWDSDAEAAWLEEENRLAGRIQAEVLGDE